MNNLSECRSCHAPMMWVATEATAKKPSRNMPIDCDEAGNLAEFADGNLVLTDEHNDKGLRVVRYVKPSQGTYRSHFASCPQRDLHRRS